MVRGKWTERLITLLVGLLMVGGVLVGCNTGLLPGAGDTDQTADDDGTDPAPAVGLWSDAPQRVSTIRLGADGSPSSSVARSLNETDRVYFRSSDIEFWHIDSVEDIGSLVSAKYVGTIDYALNHSLEYKIGDGAESIVFSPAADMTQSIDRPDLNPNWGNEVAAFVAAGKTTINAMRLDIGAGHVTFVIDGEERIVQTASGDDAGGINGNSIFFVDEVFLSEPILITRDIEQEVIAGIATAESIGISDAEFAIVNVLHTSSNWIDGDTPIDVNGALILPVSPVDLTGFDPLSETLDIVVNWDIANAVHLRDGEYFMDDRVGGTAFDFAVQVVRGTR